ncbi:MAG: hypothetical protein GTN78_06830, partial [Gemmatimonadales bacterium]|nr:hypothetical protein [Gemmatimonadales bacterium]
MRSWMLPILTAALLGVSGTLAATMPSLGGPTGVITLPSANIAPMNQWQTALTLRTFDVETMYDPSSTVL